MIGFVSFQLWVIGIIKTQLLTCICLSIVKFFWIIARLFLSLLPCTGSKQAYKQGLKESFFNCCNLEKKWQILFIKHHCLLKTIFSCSVAVYVMYLKELFAWNLHVPICYYTVEFFVHFTWSVSILTNKSVNKFMINPD